MGAMWLPVADLTAVPLSSVWFENTWYLHMAQHFKDSESLFSRAVRNSVVAFDLLYCDKNNSRLPDSRAANESADMRGSKFFLIFRK